MNIRYPSAFVEQALIKAYNRKGRSITSVAEDLSVGFSIGALKNNSRL
jgi:hypothetical protein